MAKLLTGNELKRGDVLWWTGEGWSFSIGAAVEVSADEGEALLAREGAKERVADLALIDAERVDGKWRPVKIRERIRSFGPTVRGDLALQGQDWR
jgi:hypothetical protein